MRSPFPGMDPYLEDPDRWPDVHLNLLSWVGRLLMPQLGPAYVARIQWREFLVEPDDPALDSYLLPDVGIRRRGYLSEPTLARHRFLEVRPARERRAVTA